MHKPNTLHACSVMLYTRHDLRNGKQVKCVDVRVNVPQPASAPLQGQPPLTSPGQGLKGRPHAPALPAGPPMPVLRCHSNSWCAGVQLHVGPGALLSWHLQRWQTLSILEAGSASAALCSDFASGSFCRCYAVHCGANLSAALQQSTRDLTICSLNTMCHHAVSA